MFDENENEESEVEMTEIKTPVMDAIKSDAKSLIDLQQHDGKVRIAVVETLVKEEIDRRSQLLLKGYRTLLASEEELAKLRPDHKVHIKGEIIEGFTEDQMKKRKAVLKKMSKQNSALAAAIEKADYGPLTKIAQNNG